MHRELPLLIICHFYTEKKCPCMERTSNRTATNKMLAFIIYYLLCICTEAKSWKLYDKVLSYKSPFSSKYPSHNSREHCHHLHNSHRPNTITIKQRLVLHNGFLKFPSNGSPFRYIFLKEKYAFALKNLISTQLLLVLLS